MVSRKVLAVVGVMSSGILFVAMGNTPEPFVYTQAARHEDRAFTTADGRFPAGARLMLHTSAGTRALAPSLAASADAAVSFDATRVLFAGKQSKGDTWQIWEVPLAGGAPRQITSGTEDCITPFYLPDGKIVYARKKPGGFQIEIAALAGGEPLQLTYTPGDHIPDGVLRDGRVLYEAPHPRPDSQNWDIWTVYTDGSGVETYRCDHGPDRHAAAEVASGDIVFSTRGRLAKFTSARADQVELQLPPGEYAGPVAETASGRWLVDYRPAADLPFGIYRLNPEQPAEPVAVVKSNAFQPVSVAPRAVPPRHPSGLGNREGANTLCLNAYVSKTARIPAGSISEVRVWSLTDAGKDVPLGQTKVDPDGSFFLQLPSERPLRFELLDDAGKTVQAEKGWFWMRRGEQRVCVGCHAGPERAPENVAPQVLLRTQTPVRMGLPIEEGGGK